MADDIDPLSEMSDDALERAYNFYKRRLQRMAAGSTKPVEPMPAADDAPSSPKAD
jgi:hypothetical protein